MRTVIGLLCLISLSAYAGNVSKTHCQVVHDPETNVITLSNDITEEIKMEDGTFYAGVSENCLDLVKRVGTKIDGKEVKGIQLNYINPDYTED